MKVALACRLFGRCRQAFYQSKADIVSELKRERVIIGNVREIRKEDPGIGGYKLWVMLCALFGSGFMPGRDSFYTLLRRHHLMLPPRKVRHTTNSNHRYHKWKNLVKGLVPAAANQIWVADITYIELADGNVCYLHLITDAYSHKIVGWALADTLRAAITMQALEQATSQAVAMKGSENLEGLIHHSDRGVQYCCDDYVAMLQSHGIAISMTEDYNPTDNAIAERTNGIIKIERVYSQRHFNDIEHARNVIGRYIHFYNYYRPHMSIGYKVPAVAHLEQGEQKRMWKKKKTPQKASKMKIMMYYCKAERQSRVKAYAGAPDQKSNAPSRGIRFCRTTESGLCMSRVSDYKNSTIYKEVSTYTAPLLKKCLLT